MRRRTARCCMSLLADKVLTATCLLCLQFIMFVDFLHMAKVLLGESSRPTQGNTLWFDDVGKLDKISKVSFNDLKQDIDAEELLQQCTGKSAARVLHLAKIPLVKKAAADSVTKEVAKTGASWENFWGISAEDSVIERLKRITEGCNGVGFTDVHSAVTVNKPVLQRLFDGVN